MSKAAANKGKKTGTLAANRSKRARRATVVKRANPAAANPPVTSDLLNVVLPGFGAYAASRTVSRVAFSLVQKRWPKLGKHAHALAGVASFGGVWLLAHRFKRLAKYHDGIVVGSGIAALHGLAQAYLPAKYRWLLTDPKPEDVAAPALPVRAAVALPAPAIDEDLGSEDDDFSRMLERMERNASKVTRTIAPPRPSSAPIANAMSLADDGDGDLDPDLAATLGDEDVDDLYSGSFSANN
jgi:hypothetical protein